MIRIQVRPNEPLETALRRFKRQCNYAGIFRLAKKTSVFEKPSEKRRREQRERVRNVQRAVRKAQQHRKARRKGFKPRGGAGKDGAPEGGSVDISAVAAVPAFAPRAAPAVEGAASES